jgi:hypothetical protein
MAQELKRDQPVRLPNPSAQPFVAALRTCRFFAVIFFWVTMVCVLAYTVAFVLTEGVGLYDAPRTAEAPAARPAPAEPAPAPAAPGEEPAPAAPSGTSWLSAFENTAAAAEPPKFFGVPATPAGKETSKEAPKEPAKAAPADPSKEPAAPAAKEGETRGEAVAKPETPLPERSPPTPEQQRARAEYYYDVSMNILKPLRILGVISSFLLGMTLFLYLQIALLGRLSGIKHLTSALFFALLFFVTVLPWESIFEGFRVNVFYDFARLVAAHGQRLAGNTGDFWEQAKYFARFLGLPLVSLFLLAWSGLQFASGYNESVVANE